MNEQELDLQLNRNTKLVMKGSPGKSVVLEIRRAVNCRTLGHGWLTESQVFLDAPHVAEIRDYAIALAPYRKLVADAAAHTPAPLQNENTPAEEQENLEKNQ
jgi:hypothetical protein